MERRFTAEQLDVAKRINLREFLENNGVQFNRQGKTNSPFREDAHPSFVVFPSTRGDNAGQWIGYDQARGESYDAIKVVSQFLGIDFVTAVKKMLEYSNSPQTTVEVTGGEENVVEYNNGLPAKYSTNKGNVFTYNWIDNNDERARSKALKHLVEDRRFPPEALDFLLNNVGCNLVEIKQENTAYPPRLYLGIKNIHGGWSFKSLDKYSFNHALPPAGLSISQIEKVDNETHANVVVVESLLNAGAFRYAMEEYVYIASNYKWGGDIYLITLNSVNNAHHIENVLRSLSNKYETLDLFSYTDFDEAGGKANEKIVEIIEKLQGEGGDVELVEIARGALSKAFARIEKDFNELAGGATPIEKIKDLKGCLYVESETKILREKLSRSQDINDIINTPQSLEDEKNSVKTAWIPSP